MATQLLAFAKLVIWLLWKPLGQSVLIMIIGFLVMYMFIDSYRTNCIKNAVECSCIVVYYQKSSLQNIVFVVALTLSCLRIAIQYLPLSGVALSSRNPDSILGSSDNVPRYRCNDVRGIPVVFAIARTEVPRK